MTNAQTRPRIVAHSGAQVIQGRNAETCTTGVHAPLNMTVDAYEMDEQQFLFLQQLLTGRTGIRFRDQAHLCRKLDSRLRTLNLDSYARYIELIKKKSDEILHAIEAVTTNETFFFRDFIHLIALEKYLDTYLNATRVFRIWSAASSSGEEVYSIAMTVHAWATARRIAPHNIRITGSDIDRSVLKRAIDGLYHRCQVERTPQDYKAFLLRYLEQHSSDYFNVKPHIKAMVRFKRFNLTQPLPFSRKLDVIFCRNVFLYFSQALRNEIFTSMHQALRPGGLLVMGLCEPMPVDLPLGFTYVGNSMYTKTG